MPEWVVVGENERGEPVVVVEWVLDLVAVPVAAVKSGHRAPAVFASRWGAKRLIRKRHEAMHLRPIHREKL